MLHNFRVYEEDEAIHPLSFYDWFCHIASFGARGTMLPDDANEHAGKA